MAENKNSKHRESFVSGIIKNNPLFVALLGTCPALAVTTSFESAFGMGLLFTFVLFCSNIIISALRKLIPDVIHTPAYIVVIAAFVTITKMLTQAFLPELYDSLGVFLSLLVVNCIVLGRAEAFASKNGVVDSMLDALGNGIGYTLAISIIGIVREALGNGFFAVGKIFTFLPKVDINILRYGDVNLAMSFFQTSAGGFVVMAIAIAILTAIQNKKNTKAKVDARIAMQQKLAAKKAAATATKPQEAK